MSLPHGIADCNMIFHRTWYFIRTWLIGFKPKNDVIHGRKAGSLESEEALRLRHEKENYSKE